MAFYDLPKQDRINVVASISNTIANEFEIGKFEITFLYFSNGYTYIRKSAYLSNRRLYFGREHLQKKMINMLDQFLLENDFRVLQTVMNASGEIGETDFEIVQHFFDKGMFDSHHSSRNEIVIELNLVDEISQGYFTAFAKTAI